MRLTNHGIVFKQAWLSSRAFLKLVEMVSIFITVKLTQSPARDTYGVGDRQLLS